MLGARAHRLAPNLLIVLDDAHALQRHEPAVRVAVHHLGAQLLHALARLSSRSGRGSSRRLRAVEGSWGGRGAGDRRADRSAAIAAPRCPAQAAPRATATSHAQAAQASPGVGSRAHLGGGGGAAARHRGHLGAQAAQLLLQLHPVMRGRLHLCQAGRQGQQGGKASSTWWPASAHLGSCGAQLVGRQALHRRLQWVWRSGRVRGGAASGQGANANGQRPVPHLQALKLGSNVSLGHACDLRTTTGPIEPPPRGRQCRRHSGQRWRHLLLPWPLSPKLAAPTLVQALLSARSRHDSRNRPLCSGFPSGLSRHSAPDEAPRPPCEVDSREVRGSRLDVAHCGCGQSGGTRRAVVGGLQPAPPRQHTSPPARASHRPAGSVDTKCKQQQ